MPSYDPLLFQLILVRAFRQMAEEIDGRLKPDEQIEWAVKVGFMAEHPGGERGKFVVTERGMAFAYVWARRHDELLRDLKAQRITVNEIADRATDEAAG